MRIDHAPMEGITNSVYRQAFARCFGGVDRYYTPFLSPTQNHTLTAREREEVDPERNAGLDVVPQLLANDAGHFLWACGELRARGYTRVNLNLGCPSGTVVAKKKGSGFLSDPVALERFLDAIFAGADGMEISIKTRVGRWSEDEWPELLRIYSRYPLAELIVHPRLQKDLYRLPVRPTLFEQAVQSCPFPLSYNGDIFSLADADAVRTRYPQLCALMLARGLVADPFLARRLAGDPTRSKAALEEFHDCIFGECARLLSGDRPLLNHMKELWNYQLPLFTNWEDYRKPLRKAQSRAEYEAVIGRLFRCEELRPETPFCPPYAKQD